MLVHMLFCEGWKSWALSMLLLIRMMVGEKGWICTRAVRIYELT